MPNRASEYRPPLSAEQERFPGRPRGAGLALARKGMAISWSNPAVKLSLRKAGWSRLAKAFLPRVWFCYGAFAEEGRCVVCFSGEPTTWR
jgi:hypothetical protein